MVAPLKHEVFYPEGDGTALVFLPGRGGNAITLMQQYAGRGLENKTKIAMQPTKEWYPSPRGRADQKEAVTGLAKMGETFNEYLKEVLDGLKIVPEKVSLIGFSAGAVVALQAASVAPWKYGAVLFHNGCVLDPNILGQNKHNLHVRVYHSKDDMVFEWNERYVPTKEALQAKGYKAIYREKDHGGHSILTEDIVDAVSYLK